MNIKAITKQLRVSTLTRTPTELREALKNEKSLGHPERIHRVVRLQRFAEPLEIFSLLFYFPNLFVFRHPGTSVFLLCFAKILESVFSKRVFEGPLGRLCHSSFVCGKTRE